MRLYATARILAAGGWLMLGCNGSEGPGTGPPIPSGPPPDVSVSLGFGDPPTQGFVYLRPRPDTRGWSYEVDLDEDGSVDHEGVLEREIGFGYSFDSPGVHRVAVTLIGPQGSEVAEVPVVVSDPAAVRVLNQRAIVDPGSNDHGPFEGITMDHAGRSLYVGDFGRSEIYGLDALDLQTLIRPVSLAPDPPVHPRFYGGVEGLATTPSDSLLIVAHSSNSISVVAIPSLVSRGAHDMEGKFFIHALDDTLAISTGSSGLVLVDIRSGVTLRKVSIPSAWHFAVSAEKDLIAVLEGSRPPSLRLVSLTTFQELGHVPLPDLFFASVVAFDPIENKAYVMGWDEESNSHFLLIDIASRSVILDLPLGPGACGYCVANPTATALSGRFVAMEQGGGVYFIDASLDLPSRYMGLRTRQVGMSVTASPIEDVFYLLRSDGLLTKVRIEE